MVELHLSSKKVYPQK
ncbi:hypothetical protein FWK35_00012559 [Aphis craccivora]|uniref:Uncharacterized protein n=1 Tax=Aphis craccivora TaxID=307492 RepID=A0A6G0Z9M3_APHCR|nr:hypothetical protein FWK35_00012559 [Aphis craccivora]